MKHPILGVSTAWALQVYMVRSFGRGRYSEQMVAQLTGFLAASSSFSRTFTSMLWGKASDHTGRMVRFGCSTHTPCHLQAPVGALQSCRML